MKKLITLLLLLPTLLFAQSEITPGYTFTDGSRLTASQLGLLVSQATINTYFYTGKNAQTNLGANDIILVYSSASGTFHKITGSQAVFQNPTLISSQPVYSSVNNTNYWLLGYDGNNVTLFQFNVTNILTAITNFTPLLASYMFSPDLGDTPKVFERVFKPYNFYGTNAAGFQNSWYGTTNFPITNFFMPNSAGTRVTNFSAVTSTDSIPYLSLQLKTNTSVTVDALYQYFTNRGAFPPYTQARIQFSGNYTPYPATNISVANNCIFPSNFVASGVNTYAVSFRGAAGFLVSSPQILSNICYYITPTNFGAGWFYIYTNYAQAVVNDPLSAVQISSFEADSSATMLYLTNFTSVNADAIQLVDDINTSPGQIDIVFRTTAADRLYYISGSCQNMAGSAAYLSLSEFQSPPFISTNKVRIVTATNGVGTTCDRVEVLVQPQ